VALRDVLLVAEDPDSSSYEAVGHAASAVYVCAFHYDAVHHLGVGDGGVVSYACVGADVGVGANLEVVACARRTVMTRTQEWLFKKREE